MKPLVIHISAFLALGSLISGCASSPQKLVTAPVHIRPQYTPVAVEDSPGSIYQPNRSMLLFEEPIANRVGDALKINIAENLSSSNNANTTTSRNSTIAETGPGALSSMGGLLKEIFNYSGKASGSSSLKGVGQVTNTNQISGSLMVSVTDILPNGYMAIAGEKAVAASGNTTVLRFSGIVNKRDIKVGNVVSSSDVGDARIEQVINGVATDVATQTDAQRFFAGLINFW
ncbi:MAG: flagellar basal body L-ring protein FlgH [Aquitalea sp.]|nr:flagellar basal body L-ring protein FlgH [Aquitalea sp.]